MFLVERGHHIAVLAVDPSSGLTGGSILGDKTRMERLSTDTRAYIRPTPSSGALGGVAEHTREAMLVCEAAGYDVVLVETVGVGQSETSVAGMTDLFLLLQLPNAGDDLQAMKKGIMELADLVVINKSDLDADAALRAEAQVTSALRVLRHPGGTRWQTRVLRTSALSGEGIAALWDTIEEFRRCREADGGFADRRRRQSLNWMWDEVHARLLADFRGHPAVRTALPETLAEVEGSRLAPSSGARRLLDLFEQPSRPS
jgi:LAO/AO transport system kinase